MLQPTILAYRTRPEYGLLPTPIIQPYGRQIFKFLSKIVPKNEVLKYRKMQFTNIWIDVKYALNTFVYNYLLFQFLFWWYWMWSVWNANIINHILNIHPLFNFQRMNLWVESQKFAIHSLWIWRSYYSIGTFKPAF